MTRARWQPGIAPADYSIVHARAVLPDQLLDDAVIVVRDHRIAEVYAGSGRAPDCDIDAEGAVVTPGLIDTHTDALEKERRPRATSEVPVDFALTSLEGRLRGAGVTTVYHGSGFRTQVKQGITRTPQRAREAVEAIRAAEANIIDHRVLHRLEVYSPEGTAAMRELLTNDPPQGHPALVSIEDHSPGQGQYPRREMLLDHLMKDNGMSREDAEERADQSLRQAAENQKLRAETEKWLSGLVARGAVRLLAHDPDSPESIARLADLGGAVAEFPTTLEAARAAREHGLIIAGGAPNALRGCSHSGNVSVAQLVENDCVDALTSDYLPAALMGGVRMLLEQKLVDLPRGVALVTSGPARLIGSDDRGEIAEGKLADLAFWDMGRRWPKALTTLKACPEGSQ